MSQKSKIKVSSNRSFGLVFFVVFLIIGLWPLLDGGQFKIWSLFFSLLFLVLGLMNSKLLTPINLLWTKFGILLGNIFAPIVMSFIFFLVVTPIGLLMRIMGRDLLRTKYNKSGKSYWIKREKRITKMNQQF
tara:strand:+ start:123 stop:518 length:396 start_codon:yes stop_codon:yes gene_type:complete